MSEECDYDFLHDSSNAFFQKCEHVRLNCGGEFFNLLSLHYCHIQKFPLITLIISIIILLLCFSFLSSTGNNYLANILGILSEKLHMSQNLAGLTLLALGNQAPDIAVAILAGGDADEGVEASLSSLLGGGFIVVGLVLSTVIFLGDGVSVLSYNYLRDLGVYLIGMTVLLLIGKSGKFRFWQCLLQLGLYIVYVIICFLMDKYLNPTDDNISSDKGSGLSENFLDDSKEYDVRLFNNDDDFENSFNVNSINNNNENNNNENNKNENNKNENNNNENNNNINENNENENNNNENNKNENNNNENININENNNNKNDVITNKISDEKFIQRNMNKKTVSGFRKKPIKFNIDDVITKYFYLHKSKSKLKSEKKKKNSPDKNQLQMYSKFRYNLIKYYLTSNKSNKEFEKKTTFEKILFILIDRPFNLVRDLTIPPFEQEKWNRQLFILLPITLSFFLSIIFHLNSYYWYTTTFIILWYILMFLISIFFFRISYRGTLPKCEWTLLLIALVISILWIYSVTNILMDMITCIRILLPVNLSESFLTMTVLAFGNSLPDFIVNCSLAKNGYAEMALSGSIGAPAFGLLFGFGMSLIRKSMQNKFKPFEFDLFKKNVDNYIILSAMGNLYLLLIMYIVFGIVQKFNLTRLVSLFGYSIYIIYFGFIVYFAFLYDK